MGGLSGFSVRYDGVLPLPITKRKDFCHSQSEIEEPLTFLMEFSQSLLQQNGFISYWKVRDNGASHVLIETWKSFLVRNRGAPPIRIERNEGIADLGIPI